MASESRQAAAMAAKEGISVEVIDLRTVAPWDREVVLASARKTGRVLVVHEAVKQHGIGAEIASVLNEELFGQLKKPVKRMGGAYCAVPYSKPLEDAFAPNAVQIVAAIKDLAS
jgi:pyruvate dehydrogenase E1 component beta subunit